MHQVCYFKIIEIFNQRKDIEVEQEVRALYDWAFKLN